MIRIENHCCGCAIPCIDCGRKAVEVYCCDKCDEELDEVYEDEDGKHYCEEHLLAKYKKVFRCAKCGDELEEIYEYDGKYYCDSCLLDKFRKEF